MLSRNWAFGAPVLPLLLLLFFVSLCCSIFSFLCSVLRIIIWGFFVVFPLSIGHCVACPSNFGFWLAIRYLQADLIWIQKFRIVHYWFFSVQKRHNLIKQFINGEISYSEYVCALILEIYIFPHSTIYLLDYVTVSSMWCFLFPFYYTRTAIQEYLCSHPVFYRVCVAHNLSSLCCVFCFLCLRSVSCAQCWQCLWIIHYWLPLRFSLTFS